MKLGRNLIVALDGVAVAAAKTCALDIDQNFLEACSPVSGRTLTKIPTTYNWGVSVDGLIANNSSPTIKLQDLLIDGTKCFLTFTDGSGNRRAGFVYVKSCKESGHIGNLATYSATFESTGELDKYNVATLTEFEYSDRLSIICDKEHVEYTFSQEALGRGVFGVQITPQQNGTSLFMNINGGWAIYNASLSTISEAIQNEDEQTFDETYIASDVNRGMINNIPLNTYTVIMDANSAMSGEVLLVCSPK